MYPLVYQFILLKIALLHHRSSLELGSDVVSIVREVVPVKQGGTAGKKYIYRAFIRNGMHLEVSEQAYNDWLERNEVQSVELSVITKAYI